MRIGESPRYKMVTPTYPVSSTGTAERRRLESAGVSTTGRNSRRFEGNTSSPPDDRPHLYADYKDMLAADDGKPETTAAIHEVRLLWNKKFTTRCSRS